MNHRTFNQWFRIKGPVAAPDWALHITEAGQSPVNRKVPGLMPSGAHHVASYTIASYTCCFREHARNFVLPLRFQFIPTELYDGNLHAWNQVVIGC